MTPIDNELLLVDRLDVIRKVNDKYDLETNAYISFSGGKDSTILHYLIDMALPNNHIPRVFINTGIEYDLIKEFVQELAKNDNRIIILNSGVNIKQMLEKVGYPFKSKEHSMVVDYFNKGYNSLFIQKYLRKTDYNGTFVCPKKLLYQFEERGKYHYSNLCCYELKKKPILKWQKDNNKTITLTGMRKEEGGNRSNIKGCILTNKNGNIVKFHPLLVVNEDFENWFISKFNIKLCRLYYEPFNFNRTGCKGCPFALDLQDELTIMELYLPNEKKQCEIIWGKVYEEYRRLNYRLKKDEQMKLF